MLKNIAKILISVFRLIVFLEKRNHIPITSNIRKTDKNENDNERLVVVCSATESVRLSWVVKNGFTALRYLNEGNAIMPELIIAIPDAINETKRIIELRIFVLSSLPYVKLKFREYLLQTCPLTLNNATCLPCVNWSLNKGLI